MGEKKHARGGKNSQFLGKLIQILDDQNNSEVIRFDRRRKQIIVFSRNKFEQLLPVYFKHSNFESFARQLNWFGFHKVRGGHHHIFRHPQLKKGKSIWDLKSKRKGKNQQKQSQWDEMEEIVEQKLIQDQKYIPCGNFLPVENNMLNLFYQDANGAVYPSFALNQEYMQTVNPNFWFFVGL